MIEISSTVESNLIDAFLDGASSDSLAYDGCSLFSALTLALSCESLVVGSSGNEGYATHFAGSVVNDLCVDLLVASEDNEPRSLCRSAYVLADAVVDPFPSFYFCQCYNSILLDLFSGSSLSCLATELLTNELDTLALVWFRLAE